jgi:hypothetical protein
MAAEPESISMNTKTGLMSRGEDVGEKLEMNCKTSKRHGPDSEPVADGRQLFPSCYPPTDNSDTAATHSLNTDPPNSKNDENHGDENHIGMEAAIYDTDQSSLRNGHEISPEIYRVATSKTEEFKESSENLTEIVREAAAVKDSQADELASQASNQIGGMPSETCFS